MQGVAAILFVPYFLSLLYVFGVQAKFVNPVKATIRYSFFCRNAQHEDDDPACNLE